MTYKGHFENGKIVLDEPVDIADGTVVRIEIATSVEEPASDDSQEQSLAERYAEFIGIVEGLPEDAAKNVDHYLYGTPKNP
jgi:hypothetical protein